jgi:hypothetical protein
MSTIRKHVGTRVKGDEKKRVFSKCLLTIVNDSDVNTDTGNFLFQNSVSKHNTNVPTPPVPKKTTKVVPFTWPYGPAHDAWDEFAGVINGTGTSGIWV